MKTAILTLTIVFACMHVSAQSKQKKAAKPADPVVTPVSQPVAAPQIFNFRLTIEIVNAIIGIVQNSPDLDAKTANTLVKILVSQANDTTLNRPVPQPVQNSRQK